MNLNFLSLFEARTSKGLMREINSTEGEIKVIDFQGRGREELKREIMRLLEMSKVA